MGKEDKNIDINEDINLNKETTNPANHLKTIQTNSL